MTLQNKTILLVIGGGIAAYKCLDLIRRLRERGASVRVIMTAAAGEFVTPLSVSALTGEPAFSDLFNLTDEARIGHIELARSADLVIVAPADTELENPRLEKLAHYDVRVHKSLTRRAWVFKKKKGFQ